MMQKLFTFALFDALLNQLFVGKNEEEKEFE